MISAPASHEGLHARMRTLRKEKELRDKAAKNVMLRLGQLVKSGHLSLISGNHANRTIEIHVRLPKAE